MSLNARTKRLIEEWSQDFDLLRACETLGLDTDDGSLAHWSRTLSEEEARLYLAECLKKRSPQSRAEELGKLLKLEHRRFAEEWVANFHKTVQAYRAAYGQNVTDKTARSNGWKILAREDVAAYVEALHEEQSEKANLTGEMILKRLMWVAFSDITQVINVEADEDGVARSFSLKDLNRLSPSQTYAISTITQEIPKGRSRPVLKSVTMVDKMNALKALSKYFAVDLSPQELLNRVRSLGYGLTDMFPDLNQESEDEDDGGDRNDSDDLGE